MSVRKGIICGALVALTVAAANAAEMDTDSAGYLLPHCKLSSKPPNPHEQGRCMGILSGLKAAIEVAGYQMEEARIGTICVVPPNHASSPIRRPSTCMPSRILRICISISRYSS
jgi:hypothetical protein